ncbi:MAG: hypothetical protein WCB68_11165 [Pyrinomonadaceae bacterium]
MRNRNCRLLSSTVCLTLIFVVAARAQAQVKSVENLREPVVGGRATTYLDLLKKIFPDAADREESIVAQRSIPMRHLFGKRYHEAEIFEGEMKFSGLDALWVSDEGKKRLLLFLTMDGNEVFDWNESGLLALFAPEQEFKLLDVADVKTDRFSGFWETPLIPIGPHKDAAMIANYHHNSSQGYMGVSLVSVERDRLKVVFDFPTVLRLNDCATKFDQYASVKPVENSGGARRNIRVDIKVVGERDDKEDCQTKLSGYTRHYRAVLFWDQAKREYRASTKELDILQRFNEKHF